MLLVMNPFITSKLFSKKMLDQNEIRFNKNYRIFEQVATVNFEIKQKELKLSKDKENQMEKV